MCLASRVGSDAGYVALLRPAYEMMVDEGAMWLGRTALGEMGVVEILGYVTAPV